MAVEGLASFQQDEVVGFEQGAELFVDVGDFLQHGEVLLELDWDCLLDFDDVVEQGDDFEAELELFYFWF